MVELLVAEELDRMYQQSAQHLSSIEIEEFQEVEIHQSLTNQFQL
jgi:hypothetical protein